MSEEPKTCGNSVDTPYPDKNPIRRPAMSEVSEILKEIERYREDGEDANNILMSVQALLQSHAVIDKETAEYALTDLCELGEIRHRVSKNLKSELSRLSTITEE